MSDESFWFNLSPISDGSGVPAMVGKVCGVAFGGTLGGLGFAAGAHAAQQALGMTPSPIIDVAAGMTGLVLGIQAGDYLSDHNPSKSFCLLAGALVAYGAHQMLLDYHVTATTRAGHENALIG